MFKDFLKKLTPLNSIENEEWNEILEEYEKEFGLVEPTLFWYLSSGIDLKALVNFSEKDTKEVYKTPVVDFFIYSDYGDMIEKLKEYYEKMDDGLVVLYEDSKTYITLEQMVPLKYFTDREVELIKKKYKQNRHHSMKNKIIHNNIHFYYALINIESNYFQEEYFYVIFSPIENWILLEEVWKKQNVAFDYICGVCDGCRKGGAYKCVNIHYRDFLPVMKKNRSFWVSDHIHSYSKPDDFDAIFKEIAKIKGWGNYNHQISYLYKKKIWS